MLQTKFGDFIDKKKRDALHQLKLMEKILRKKGFRVEAFLSKETKSDPYVFCYNPVRNSSFDGVRIYKIGGTLAFRIQQEAETHPYGKAYPLNIEEMFQDFLSDDGVTQREAAEKVIDSVGKELKMFFEKSEEVERDSFKSAVKMNQDGLDGDIALKTTGTDYSALIFQKS